jgi:deoxyribonuclease-4
MKFGAHVSASGGISNAIDRGQAIGCESIQVFTHNPRTWKPINHKPEEIAAFREKAAAADMGPLVSHGLYLMNLGAPDKEVPTGPPAKGITRNIYRASV